MKALVIAPQPFFSPRGTPFSVYYRTLVTAGMGVKLDLLTYGEGQDVDIPNVRIIRIPRLAFLGKVTIGPSPLKLFLDLFMVIWAVGLLLRNKYDFVHAHEEAIFFCLFLKPIFRFKLIYDMHSSLPQQLTNFQFTKSRFLIGLFEKLENASIQAAEAVITICPDLADYVNRLIKDQSKHLLIENSIFEPVRLQHGSAGPGGNRAEVPVQLPPGKRFVVYAGTLEPYQGIDILVSSFSRVVKEVPDAFLLIVGGSNRQVAHYRQLAKTEGLENQVLFTGRVAPALAKHYCQLAAVQMSPRSAGTNTPLKVYEQLASGIPLVATNIYSHTQVLDDTVAVLVEPEPGHMAQGIVECLLKDQRTREITANAQKLYEEKYSRSVYEWKLKRVLQIISCERPTPQKQELLNKA